jgi:hypothetical protein
MAHSEMMYRVPHVWALVKSIGWSFDSGVQKSAVEVESYSIIVHEVKHPGRPFGEE